MIYAFDLWPDLTESDIQVAHLEPAFLDEFLLELQELLDGKNEVNSMIVEPVYFCLAHEEVEAGQLSEPFCEVARLEAYFRGTV